MSALNVCYVTVAKKRPLTSSIYHRPVKNPSCGCESPHQLVVNRYIYICVCVNIPLSIFFVSVFNKNPTSSQLAQDGFSIPAPRSSAHLLKSREASRHRASALASTGPVESTTVGTLRPWGSNDLGVVPEKKSECPPPK